MTRRILALPLLAAMAFGALAILGPEPATAFPGNGKGKGPPGGGNDDCPCAEVIEISPGVFCTLDSCAELVPDGWECNYVCPFPF